MSLHALLLPDGRRLDLYVSGPDGGVPFISHHGTPGAYTPYGPLERPVHEHGMRFVSWSRPGYGASSRHRGRRVVDVVADTEAVLSAIGADRCIVAGRSGGGPHALACAARLDAAAAVLVIAGVAPYEADGLEFLDGMGEDNLDEFGAAVRGEPDLRRYLDAQREQLKSVAAGDIIAAMAGLLPEVDRRVLTEELGENLAASFREGLRIGPDGWIDDDLAFVQPWGFALSEIRRPVSIWQGSLDLMVPFAHGRWLADHVPNASVHLLEGEGHLSVLHSEEATNAVLDELVAEVG